VLTDWTGILRERFAKKFPGPGEITAFRPEFAAHGKFGKPCPVCGTAIQRIVHAENETNYCPRCQTGGKLLADRSLSRLLKEDWPGSIEEWEAGRAPKV
jgi:formamidopyrimidine-DNA glycosylase